MECGCGLHGRPKRRFERAIIQSVINARRNVGGARLRAAAPAACATGDSHRACFNHEYFYSAWGGVGRRFICL